MRSIILIIWFTVITICGIQAQSLMVLNAEDQSDVSNGTLIRNVGLEETTVEVGAYIKNVSLESRNVMVKKYVITLVEGSEAYFCWDGCYGNTVNVSTNYITVAPGDTIKLFSGDFKHHGFSGTSNIKYTFFVDHQSTDSISLNIEYNVNLTGVNEPKDINVTSSAYPNPANSAVYFNYAISANSNGRIIIYNIIGKKVKEIEIDNQLNQVKIDVSELNRGLFIWSFEVDGMPLKTEKLLLK